LPEIDKIIPLVSSRAIAVHQPALRVSFIQLRRNWAMQTPVWQWSAVQTATAIRDGVITSEEVIEAHVERMHAVNPALNAVVIDLSEQAISDARAADRAKSSGAALGKLHGVPVTIKINIDVEGQANSNGRHRLQGQHRARPLPDDSQPEEGRRDHHRPHQHPRVLYAWLHR
jgi:hypothetical protein